MRIEPGFEAQEKGKTEVIGSGASKRVATLDALDGRKSEIVDIFLGRSP
jgi:hypothetical protein